MDEAGRGCSNAASRGGKGLGKAEVELELLMSR